MTQTVEVLPALAMAASLRPCADHLFRCLLALDIQIQVGLRTGAAALMPGHPLWHPLQAAEAADPAAAAKAKLHAWWAAAQCCMAPAPCATAAVLLQAQATLLLRQLSSLGEGWSLEQLPGTPLHPPQEPGLCVGSLRGCSPPLDLSVKLQPGGRHALFYHTMPDAEPQQQALGGAYLWRRLTHSVQHLDCHFHHSCSHNAANMIETGCCCRCPSLQPPF